MKLEPYEVKKALEEIKQDHFEMKDRIKKQDEILEYRQGRILDLTNENDVLKGRIRQMKKEYEELLRDIKKH